MRVSTHTRHTEKPSAFPNYMAWNRSFEKFPLIKQWEEDHLEEAQVQAEVSQVEQHPQLQDHLLQHHMRLQHHLLQHNLVDLCQVCAVLCPIQYILRHR